MEICFVKQETEPMAATLGPHRHTSGGRFLLGTCSLFSEFHLRPDRLELFPTVPRPQGQGSFSVSACHLRSSKSSASIPLIISGGLVLCSWIKPRQLPLTRAKLHTWPGLILRLVSGENLMCFKQGLGQVCTEQHSANAETVGDWPWRPGRVSAGLHVHVWE